MLIIRKFDRIEYMCCTLSTNIICTALYLCIYICVYIYIYVYTYV